MSRADYQLTKVQNVVDVDRPDLERFFSGAKRQIELVEQQDRKLASAFNVFDLIRPDENRLSDVLVLLLDPRGTHGQGDLFLRLLMQKLDVGLSLANTKRALVRREAATNRIENSQRRLDVLVDAGDFVAIENKVNAAEQKDQVKDYLKHLMCYTNVRMTRSVLIYLTPDGRWPESIVRAEVDQAVVENRLRCWSYGRHLRAWLEECQSQCEAARFKLFLSDFIGYIERVLQRESENQ